MLTPADFFALTDPFVAPFFDGCTFVWEPLARLDEHLARLLDGRRTIAGLVMDGAYLGDGPLFIGAGARIEPGAYVLGPAYIAPGAVVRHMETDSTRGRVWLALSGTGRLGKIELGAP